MVVADLRSSSRSCLMAVLNGAASIPLTVVCVKLKIGSCSLVALNLWSHFFFLKIEGGADGTI